MHLPVHLSYHADMGCATGKIMSQALKRHTTNYTNVAISANGFFAMIGTSAPSAG